VYPIPNIYRHSVYQIPNIYNHFVCQIATIYRHFVYQIPSINHHSVYRIPNFYRHYVYKIPNIYYHFVYQIPIYLDIHTQYCEFNVFDPANYYYWVEIGDGNGCLTKSYFNQPQFPNSIEENSLTNLIKVYPNPTSEVLYLQLEELVFEKINFNVFDISGKILFEGNLNNGKTMIDVSLLNSSIYFIEFISKNEKYTMKFIKD